MTFRFLYDIVIHIPRDEETSKKYAYIISYTDSGASEAYYLSQ